MEEDPKHFKLFGLTFPIHRKLLIQSTLMIWLALLVILFVAQIFFQYEMTNADIPGGLIAGFLLGYLTTILVK